MTLKELQKVWCGEEIASVTALAYYKTSKKYYSFRIIVDPEDHKRFRSMNLDGIGELEVKECSIGPYAYIWGCIRIDVIEWIDDPDEDPMLDELFEEVFKE